MSDEEQLPEDLPANALAIVGIGVHAPGAQDREAFWTHMVAGSVLSEIVGDEDLAKAGVSERERKNPRYVRRTYRLPSMRDFEPEFFGLTPRDAALTDPQTRHLLENCWEALEDAAIDPARPAGPIGLFVGTGFNGYLFGNLLPDREIVETHGRDKLLQLGNDRDYVAARIAYALDLRGPVTGVAASCATGSLSIHLACQSLLGRECRIALAGAASIMLPHGTGYLYEEGSISSPDGVCRSFDAAAQGTLPSSGSGVLALMRLEDALREGRDIHACILATAYNNDGRRKVGFAAPSVDGPLSAIEEALAVAGIDARSVGYVEAHGTGTAFGDSIEINALTQAFRQTTPDTGFCVLGTNKPNIGHTDAASGVMSTIKAASALSARTLPPLANFNTPHPMLDLARSPFKIITERTPWREDGPHRALVNCLAVGGSNVHIVLEEAPPPLHESVDEGVPELFALSARSAEALGVMQRRLADHLERHPELTLRDVAFTLLAGRHLFDVRKALIVSSREDAIAQLRGESARDISAVPELVRLFEMSRRFTEEREPKFEEPAARFVHLPTYPFERRTLWTEARAGANATAVLPSPRSGELPYARVKYVHCDPALQQPSPEQRFLVFVDDTGFGERVVAQLRERGCPVIAARLGSGQALTQMDEANYRIDCDRGFEGPSSLIAELYRSGRMPDVILLLWTVTTEERFRSATNRFHHDMERGYFTLLALCQGLAALESNRQLRIVAVTNDALGAGSENVQFPAKTLAFGPIAALPLEQPNVTALAIDINVPVGLKRALIVPQLLTRVHDKAAAALLPEAVGRSSGIYALRGNQLLQRTLESVPARRFEGRFPPLRPGAAYVVLGGFGNLGYALAEQLATHGKIKLVLIGRTPIPEPAFWDDWLRDHDGDDPVSERIQKVRALEGRGMEVLALGADICHLESLGSALSAARRRFGKLQGLIHAAGVLSEALCGGESQDEARDALAAEVLGTRVLDQLTRRDELDFVVTLGNATRFSPRAGTYARNAAAEFGEAYSDYARGRLRTFDLGLIRDGGMFVRWIRQLEAEGPIHDPQVLAVIAEVERGLSTQETARAVIQALGSSTERQLVIGPVPRPSAPRTGNSSSFTRSELKREYLAPEGELERKLASFWAEALHIDRIGASDDFFELGGHSLIAVRLGVKIKSTWGVTVPLATIIEAPTVRQLAAVIQEHLSLRGTRDTKLLREWTTIVPLQPRGQRPPLFCVGGKGGNVMNLRHLATLLGREQPAFGLQARGVDGSAAPHTTIEAQVEEYLGDVQRVRAKGPYLLSGFSGGGAMILEMARRLRAQGHVVGPLLFFDAWNPAAPGRDLASKLRGHAGLFRELGPRYAQVFTERWVRYRAQELLRAAAPTIAERIWEPQVALGAVADAWDVAIADYVPAPYEGDAVLFRVRADRSRGELDFSEDEQNGWGGVVLGGIEIIDVPGNHNSIVEEPHVRALAQSVQTVLERTLRRLGYEERTSQRPGRLPDDAHT